MPDPALPALVFGSLCLLLVMGAIVVILHAVRRSRKGAAGIETRGWTRLPDGPEVTDGWDGWPFLRALKTGEASDVVVGEHAGVEFMSLRWTQSEPAVGSKPSEIERYNVIAIRCEQDLPHLSLVRGHKVPRGKQHPGASEVEVGDRGFDKRWQLLGHGDSGRDLARDLLTPQVREAMDDLDGGWAFQPGWITRIVTWSYWAGEDAMLEELQRAAAPWRLVPAEAWERWGGPPQLPEPVADDPGGERGGYGGAPEHGPGRGWD